MPVGLGLGLRAIQLRHVLRNGGARASWIGNSSRCFGYIKDWAEKKIRRHLMHVKNRRGFGWKRWSRAWLYETLGLFHDYRVQHYRA